MKFLRAFKLMKIKKKKFIGDRGDDMVVMCYKCCVREKY